MSIEYDQFYAAAAKLAEDERKATQAREQARSDGRFATKPAHRTPVDRREAVTAAPAVTAHERRARETATKAAKVTGASGTGVQRMKAVRRDAPDLYDKVMADKMAMDAAYKQARQRVRQQPKPEPVARNSTMLTLRTHDGTEVLYPRPQGPAKFNETSGDGISWARWSWNPVTGCLHGCTYCLTPDTPVLMADMTWRPIGDIRHGDQLLGFDEKSPRWTERRWRPAEVTATWRTTQTAYRVVFEGGREIVASAEHKWLCNRNTWRTTETLRAGTLVQELFDSHTQPVDDDYRAGYISGITLGEATFRWDPTWRSDKLGFLQSYWRLAILESDRIILDRTREYLAYFGINVETRRFQHSGTNSMLKIETRKLANMPRIDGLCERRDSDSWHAGWLAAMLDGEGSVSGGSLRIHQLDIAVLEDVVSSAARLGFEFRIEKYNRPCATARLCGNTVEQARFGEVTRPALARKAHTLTGRKVRVGRARVASITKSVDVEMVDITTSTSTFIADGLLTHNCYARAGATSERLKTAYPVGFTPLFHHQRLDAPANTHIPERHLADPAWRRVFVCSMADLYGRWVPDEWIERVHASMIASPQWQYITLTKFPGRYVGLDMPPGAWVGTSVDEQKRVRLAEDAFRKIEGVKVKWLSLEPLREPLEFTDLSMFDWVVIGAQTETRQPGHIEPAFAPPFDWVSRIVAQADAAGCKIHMKPNLMGRTDPGSPGMGLRNEYPDDPEETARGVTTPLWTQAG